MAPASIDRHGRRRLLRAALLLAWPATAGAAPRKVRTRDEAVALVRRAAAFVRSAGRERALAEFSRPDGQFVDGELYIFVYGADGSGVLLAHPMFPLLIGKNLLDMSDADGVPITRRVLEIGAGKSGRGWVDYHWPNGAAGRQVELKTSYVERVDDLILGCGLPKQWVDAGGQR
ncbi:cache domain-containing protein [Duganella rhizosphaerae]|uniref:cache domain-containing protein n=1 Tax=Duganella rhizosphaerae TaxID=2885763 RepID=UPI00403F8424